MKGKAFFWGFLWSCGRSIFVNTTWILAFALLTPFAHAQSTGGRIRGTVTDPSAGAVVGATVTLINEATHATRDVQTGANGEYIFLEVPVGSYEIDASSQGFKKYARKGRALQDPQSSDGWLRVRSEPVRQLRHFDVSGRSHCCSPWNFRQRATHTLLQSSHQQLGCWRIQGNSHGRENAPGILDGDL